jgi:hypothetical protein
MQTAKKSAAIEDGNFRTIALLHGKMREAKEERIFLIAANHGQSYKTEVMISFLVIAYSPRALQ